MKIRAAALYEQGKPRPFTRDRLRSGEIGFQSLNEGYDRLANGEAVRQRLLPHGSA